MYTVEEIKKGCESGINSKGEISPSFIYILCITVLDYVSISVHSYSTGNYIL